MVISIGRSSSGHCASPDLHITCFLNDITQRLPCRWAVIGYEYHGINHPLKAIAE
jgi:hypothetical protein